MEQPIELKLDFTDCPNCHSTRRLAEEATKFMKKKGWALEDFTYYTHIIQGTPTDKRVFSKIPIGSSIPIIWAGMDICLDCGTVYAVRVASSKAQLTIGTPGKLPPDFKTSEN